MNEKNKCKILFSIIVIMLFNLASAATMAFYCCDGNCDNVDEILSCYEDCGEFFILDCPYVRLDWESLYYNEADLFNIAPIYDRNFNKNVRGFCKQVKTSEMSYDYDLRLSECTENLNSNIRFLITTSDGSLNEIATDWIDVSICDLNQQIDGNQEVYTDKEDDKDIDITDADQNDNLISDIEQDAEETYTDTEDNDKTRDYLKLNLLIWPFLILGIIILIIEVLYPHFYKNENKIKTQLTPIATNLLPPKPHQEKSFRIKEPVKFHKSSIDSRIRQRVENIKINRKKFKDSDNLFNIFIKKPQSSIKERGYTQPKLDKKETNNEQKREDVTNLKKNEIQSEMPKKERDVFGELSMTASDVIKAEKTKEKDLTKSEMPKKERDVFGELSMTASDVINKSKKK
ncbi:MAG: hypothetical protein PHV16_04880 [Candidatus Nanoarchaeia archaeon]|nr:hypothetical protein [Candidatus Nanoarchaeia archaeon]